MEAAHAGELQEELRPLEVTQENLKRACAAYACSEGMFSIAQIEDDVIDCLLLKKLSFKSDATFHAPYCADNVHFVIYADNAPRERVWSGGESRTRRAKIHSLYDLVIQRTKEMEGKLVYTEKETMTREVRSIAQSAFYVPNTSYLSDALSIQMSWAARFLDQMIAQRNKHLYFHLSQTGLKENEVINAIVENIFKYYDEKSGRGGKGKTREGHWKNFVKKYL